MNGGESLTSTMTRRERLAALLYLPIHALLLPLVISSVAGTVLSGFSTAVIDAAYYALGFVLMLAFEWSFLRRDFDVLCERPLSVLVSVGVGYMTMFVLNFMMVAAMNLLLGDGSALTMVTENPNNNAVMELVELQYGPAAATSIFLAPLLEELLFRGAVFGTLMRKNRTLAYVVTLTAFGLYHVWQAAIYDPWNLLFIVQYIPAGFALCLTYEKSDTIWSPILLHMLINFIAVKAMGVLTGM